MSNGQRVLVCHELLTVCARLKSMRKISTKTRRGRFTCAPDYGLRFIRDATATRIRIERQYVYVMFMHVFRCIRAWQRECFLYSVCGGNLCAHGISTNQKNTQKKIQTPTESSALARTHKPTPNSYYKYNILHILP